MTLHEAIAAIRPIDPAVRARAQARMDQLTKPVSSLGRLEELAVRYAVMIGEERPKLPRVVVFTFAADHGVCAEGVSAYPSAVTAQMVLNFLRGGAAVNVLAAHVGAEVRVVDIGVAYDFGSLPGLIVRKVAYGTHNFAREAAMSWIQATEALEVGLNLATEAAGQGIGLIGTGDMGIGNTTAGAAITAVMANCPVAEVTGRGTGIDDAGLARKIRTIEYALARHRPDAKDPIDVLAKVGGYELAGLAGVMLGAAAHRMPVVLDGFIVGAAALIAAALQPRCADYLFASHLSVEPGHRVVCERLGLRPLLNLGMRLGEGTGACLAIGLIQASIKLFTRMATFEEAGVARRSQ